MTVYEREREEGREEGKEGTKKNLISLQNVTERKTFGFAKTMFIFWKHALHL